MLNTANTTKDSLIVASGFSAQMYFWLDKANLILSVGVGLVTFIYSVLRLIDYIKKRKKKK